MTQGSTAWRVVIWPSAAARQAALSQAVADQPRGFLLVPPQYTSDGLLQLLPRLFPGAGQDLPSLAGPLLVGRLLNRHAEEAALFRGLAAGWRLPERLWRLLLEIKAAGLEAQDLAATADSLASPRLAALAGLLGAYQATLEELGLADSADHLVHLEERLAAGEEPAILAAWGGVEFREVLWLRTLDLRLVLALSRVRPVAVHFSLLPPAAPAAALDRLTENTARVLERDAPGQVSLHWPGPDQGPLAGLAGKLWDPARDFAGQGREHLELWRPAGRYGEAEALARRAQELLAKGAASDQVAILFPDLELYGPMVADAAGRLGLPLDFQTSEPLDQTPLTQALLACLALPARHYPRLGLARALASPYLTSFLNRLAGRAVPPDAGRLLALAGYVDGQETPLQEVLTRAAHREHAPTRDLLALAELAQTLARRLDFLARRQNLAAYTAGLLDLFREMDSLAGLSSTTPAPAGGGPSAWEVLARDTAAWQGLLAGVTELGRAAAMVRADEELSPGRLHALLQAALALQEAPGRAGLAGGVRVLRLDQAHGLSLDHLLVGGLSQEGFPRRPRGNPLLSGPERLELGRRAGLPVWRTDEEEYGGQVMSLLVLLARTRHAAVLSAPAADPTGGELAPASLVREISLLLDLPLPEPEEGGVFAEAVPLAEARQERALWNGLTSRLLKPRAGVAGPEEHLAQAALWHLLAAHPDRAATWQDLQSRVALEAGRLAWDLVSDPAARLAAAGPFSGHLGDPSALALLAQVLAAPHRRRFSPSSLESYASCPLAWFLGRILGLAEDLEPGWGLDRAGEGRWVHQTLANFFAPAEFDPAWDADQRAARLAACLEEARQELRRRGEGGHPLVWSARHAVLAAGLTTVVEREWQDLGGLRPLLVEEPLGGRSAEGQRQGLGVTVDDGPPLELSGILDRLDQGKTPAGDDLLRVTDYKHSSRAPSLSEPVKRELWGETRFQLPVYLAAARERLGLPTASLEGRIAPTYLVGSAAKSVELPPGDTFLATDPAQRAELAQRGEPNLFNALTGLWSRICHGDFRPNPTAEACPLCALAPVCRARVAPGAGEEAGA
ncbi:MAG: PD-(D/E)XK nuclease family protein [Deltaproteobacteria bacterium]|nr:PD-(D/E)XK nuclease family protein [Deltaproteobacteria bacterium]